MNFVCESMPGEAEENDDVGARAREPPSSGTGAPVPCSPLRTPPDVPPLVDDLNSESARKRVPRVSANINVVCG